MVKSSEGGVVPVSGYCELHGNLEKKKELSYPNEW